MRQLVSDDARVRFRRGLTRYLQQTPFTPARIVRLLRAPSIGEAVGGRIVMITGSSSGIGRATALKLGAAGATVLLVARRADELEDVRAGISAGGGRAYVHPCDLRDRDEVDRLTTDVLSRYGHVDVLVNNAGRSIRRSIDESYDRLHDYERTMRLNYFASVQLILAVLPAMRERHDGHIVNVLTMGVQGRAPRWSAYIASKSALDAFSNVLAVEARADGVQITNINFPLVHTPMSAPTGIYNGAPGLSSDEAADVLVEAIRAKPARISPRLGVAFQTGWLASPSGMQRLLGRFYRRSLEREQSARIADETAQMDTANSDVPAGAHERSVR